ncbi:hypothetical protein [Roseibium alexandrii]|uniref:hypothetical protein n=1 Tax=Roseibium alexandrii TaxID=388408 RepID=UPI00375227F4
MSDDLSQRLGKIEGLLEGIDKKVDRLDDRTERQDDRLRVVERKTWTNSILASGIISVGIAMVKDKFIT